MLVLLGSGETLASEKSDKSSINYVDSLLDHAEQYFENEEDIHLAYDDLLLGYDLAKELNYREGIIRSCRNLGNFYLNTSDNVQATTYFYLFLKEAEKDEDSLLISEAQMRLGLVMYNMDKWKEGLEYLQSSEEIILSLSHGERTPTIKLITYLKGLCYLRLDQLEKAQVLLTDAHAWAIDDNDSMRMGETALALNVIRSKDSPDSSVFNEYRRLLRFFQRRQETVGICFALQAISNAHLSIGNSDTAYSYAIRSLAIAKDLKMLYPIAQVLGTLIQAEIERGNYEAAYNYQIELNILKDSANNREVASEIAMLGVSHQFEKRVAQYDAEIKENARQRRFFLILFITTLFVALIIVLMLRLVALQRRRSDNLLHNILPRETIKELQATGHSIPKAHKEVTIVFADVESFTKIASTLKPDVLVKMLDRYFEEFDSVITKYGLEKIKTIGDAYMFVSGLVHEENSVENAAKACLEMLQSVNDIKAEMNELYNIDFNFRFGMHTGNIVSGVVGKIKYAFDIWGDAVNIAARMEESSVAGKINISEACANHLGDEFVCQPRGALPIKNRGVMNMFFLESYMPEGVTH